jgi:trans-aconitate methyltransferase
MTAALPWLDSWDRQQQTYIQRREERFEVIATLVEHIGGKHAAVLDLGCGPGSLLRRLQTALPEARLVGVDFDPVLLAMGRSVLDEGRTTLLDGDLRADEWELAARAHGPYDVVVSCTALHWLAPDELLSTYASAGRLLRPGGWLLNGDTMPLTSVPKLNSLLPVTPATQHGESPWQSWWHSLQDSGEYAQELDERALRRRHSSQPAEFMPAAHWHVQALSMAGFIEADVIWRDCQEAIVAACLTEPNPRENR